jgi:hypothetical protein
MERDRTKHEEEGRIIKTGEKARAGRPVVWVVIVSTCLLMVLYTLMYFGYFGA